MTKIGGYDTLLCSFGKVNERKMKTPGNFSAPISARWAQQLGDLAQFEQQINQLAQAMSLNLHDYPIDHLALRANCDQTAKNWLTVLLNYGRILSDNIVNGRVIYLIELNEPLAFAGQLIDVIELPFPKKTYPIESWEHIEIVMPFLPNESVVDWQMRIDNRFLWKKQAQLSIKLSEPKAAGEQLPNPSIAVSFADKRENPVCIKVHPYSIKKILEV